MDDENSIESMEVVTRKESRLERSYRHFPYWIMPLISAAVWFAMLWAMMIVWLAQNQPRYDSMIDSQTIAYISDIGANILKPLFVTGCVITSLFFFLSLCAMRRNQALHRRLEKYLDIFSVATGGMGAISLILLSVFDTSRHPSLHRLFLFLFMLGVILSALFTTLEYRRLGKTFTDHPVLKISYRVKQGIVIFELALSIAFGVTMYTKNTNVAAILEWLIAFVFTFYVLSFFFDLRPKARTKEQLKQEMTDAGMVTNDADLMDREMGPHHHQQHDHHDHQQQQQSGYLDGGNDGDPNYGGPPQRSAEMVGV